MKTKMSPPWYGYYNKLLALFGEDPEIKVEFDESELTVYLYVNNTNKYIALQSILPDKQDFGGTILRIVLVPANKENKTTFDSFRTAFKGNPAVTDIQEVSGVFTNPILYIEFEKKVIQYYDDNLGDLHGNHSTLLEEIARDIFDEDCGVFFCTDNHKQEDNHVCDNKLQATEEEIKTWEKYNGKGSFYDGSSLTQEADEMKKFNKKWYKEHKNKE